MSDDDARAASLKTLISQLHNYFECALDVGIPMIRGYRVALTIYEFIGPSIDQRLSNKMFVDILNLRAISRACRGMVMPREGAFQQYRELLVSLPGATRTVATNSSQASSNTADDDVKRRALKCLKAFGTFVEPYTEAILNILRSTTEHRKCHSAWVVKSALELLPRLAGMGYMELQQAVELTIMVLKMSWAAQHCTASVRHHIEMAAIRDGPDLFVKSQTALLTLLKLGRLRGGSDCLKYHRDFIVEIADSTDGAVQPIHAERVLDVIDGGHANASTNGNNTRISAQLADHGYDRDHPCLGTGNATGSLECGGAADDNDPLDGSGGGGGSSGGCVGNGGGGADEVAEHHPPQWWNGYQPISTQAEERTGSVWAAALSARSKWGASTHGIEASAPASVSSNPYVSASVSPNLRCSLTASSKPFIDTGASGDEDEDSSEDRDRPPWRPDHPECKICGCSSMWTEGGPEYGERLCWCTTCSESGCVYDYDGYESQCTSYRTNRTNRTHGLNSTSGGEQVYRASFRSPQAALEFLVAAGTDVTDLIARGGVLFHDREVVFGSHRSLSDLVAIAHRTSWDRDRLISATLCQVDFEGYPESPYFDVMDTSCVVCGCSNMWSPCETTGCHTSHACPEHGERICYCDTCRGGCEYATVQRRGKPA